jgi:hypothetical protein
MKNEKFPVPTQQFDISLDSATPTPLDPNQLSQNLANIGLTCQLASPDNCVKYIGEVRKGLSTGNLKSWAYSQVNEVNSDDLGKINTSDLKLSDIFKDLGITGNYIPAATSPYQQQLYIVGAPSHFDFLFAHGHDTGTFGGVKVEHPSSGNSSTVDAIKQLFGTTGADMISALPIGLDKDATEAAFNNLLGPVQLINGNYDSWVGTDGKQHHENCVRSILLTNNYDPDGKTCDGIGVINIDWHLTIKDISNKKNQTFNYNLNVIIRAVVYSDPNALLADVAKISTTLKDKLFFRDAYTFPVPSQIQIFPTLPPANADTFNCGIPIEQTSGDYNDVIILSYGDLESIGVLDNSKSNGAVSYSKTVTSGFTFSMGQKIAAGFSYEVNAGIAKSGVNLNLELSFNETWDESTSETVQFDAPANTTVYMYQGVTKASVLRLHTSTLKLEYISSAQMKSPCVVATDKPLTGKAVVTNKHQDIIDIQNGKLPLFMKI